MKERSRLLAILLSAALMFTYMPAAAYANVTGDAGSSDTPVTFINSDGIEQDAYLTKDGFTYTKINSDGLDTVRVIAYTGGGDTIKVPATLGGRTVAGFSINPQKPVSEGESYDAIKKITLPDSAIYVRTYGMRRFPNLESVSGSNGELNNDRYKTKDGVLYKRYKSGKVKVACYPKGRTDDTWDMDKELSVSYSFPSRPYLKHVIINSRVSLGNFGNLTELESIEVKDENSKYYTKDGALYRKNTRDVTEAPNSYLFVYPPKKADKEYTVADETAYIYDEAFRGNENIEKVTLGKGCRSIYWYAFSGCKNLKTVVLSEDTKYIDYNVFDGCENLKKIVFTAASAPKFTVEEYDSGYIWSDVDDDWYGLIEAVAAGAVIEYPENGEGYDEFVAEVERLAAKRQSGEDEDYGPWEDSGEVTPLELNKSVNLNIDPEKVATFSFTAAKPGYYKVRVYSENDDEKEFEYCIYDANGNRKRSGSRWTTGEGVSVEFPTMAKGKTYYIQLKASKENTTTAFRVKAKLRSENSYLGLAELPDECEELTEGVTVKGNSASDNDVITYSFTTPASEDRTIRYVAEGTVTPEEIDDDYYDEFDAVVFAETSSTYTWMYLNEDKDDDDYIVSLKPGTKYYFQLRPGCAGEYTFRISRDEFAAVPDSDVEEIKVDETKDIKAESVLDTFTYEFTPEETGNYTFYSSGNADPQGRVLLGDEVIGENDDSKKAGEENFSISFKAEKGKTYYLQAKLNSVYEQTSFTVTLTDYIGEHKHEPVHHEAAWGDPSKDSNLEYWECSVCHNMYKDEECTKRVYDVDVLIPYGEFVTGAEFKAAGELKGNIGEKRIDYDSRYAKGNIVTITFDDGSKKVFKCVPEDEDSSWCEYYLDGDSSSYDNEMYSHGFSLSSKIVSESGRVAAGENDGLIIIENRLQSFSIPVKVTGVCGHDDMEYFPRVEADCEHDGVKAYYKCNDCGKLFSNRSATKEISKPVVIKATGHDWNEATYDWDSGFTQVTATHSCMNYGCGKVETETVGAIVEEETPATLRDYGHRKGKSENFKNEAFEAQEFDDPVPPLKDQYEYDAGAAETAASDAEMYLEWAESDDDLLYYETYIKSADAKAQAMADKANAVAAAADEALKAAEDAAAEDPTNEEKQAALAEAKNTAAAALKFKAAANTALAKTKAAVAKVAAAKTAAASRMVQEGNSDEATLQKLEEAAKEAETLAGAAAAASADAKAAAEGFTRLAKDEAVGDDITGGADEINRITEGAASTEDAVKAAEASNEKAGEAAKKAADKLELDSKKEAAGKVLDEYKDASEYREEQQKTLKKAIENGKKAIKNARDEAEIEAAVKAAKETIDKIKTDAQLKEEEAAAAAAKELSDKKDTAKADLDGYKKADDYREAQKAELAKAIEDGKKAIEEAVSKDAVDAVVAAAKQAIDKIKTDAQLTEEEKAAAEEKAKKEAEEKAKKEAEEKAKSVKTVTVNVKTVNAAALNKAIKAAGGSKQYVTSVVLGKKVKKIKAKTFAGTKVTTLTLKTKKLTKKGVKGSLKSSKVKTIKVKAGSKKVNKKLVKKYKKFFTKKNAGKKAKVK